MPKKKKRKKKGKKKKKKKQPTLPKADDIKMDKLTVTITPSEATAIAREWLRYVYSCFIGEIMAKSMMDELSTSDDAKLPHVVIVIDALRLAHDSIQMMMADVYGMMPADTKSKSPSSVRKQPQIMPLETSLRSFKTGLWTRLRRGGTTTTIITRVMSLMAGFIERLGECQQLYDAFVAKNTISGTDMLYAIKTAVSNHLKCMGCLDSGSHRCSDTNCCFKIVEEMSQNINPVTASQAITTSSAVHVYSVCLMSRAV